MSPFVLEEDCLCCKLSLSMFVMYVRDSFRTIISMCKLRWPDSGPEFEIALPHRPFLPHFPWFERNVTLTLSVCICVCICIFAYHETIYYSHSRRTYREIDRPFGPLQSNTVNDVTKTRLICCSPNMYIYICQIWICRSCSSGWLSPHSIYIWSWWAFCGEHKRTLWCVAFRSEA